MFERFWKTPGLYLAPDEGAGGGAGDDAGDDADGKGKGDGTGDTGDATGKDDGGDGKVEFVPFTPQQQAHIDKLVGNARVQARTKAQKDADAAKATEADEAEKASLKEQEKWKALSEKHEASTTAAQTERDAAMAQLQEERIGREIERVAAKLLFQDAKDAFDLIDMATIEVGEDGKVTGVEKALEKLAKDKPYLLKGEKETGRTAGTPRRGRQLQQRSGGNGERVRNAPTRPPSF